MRQFNVIYWDFNNDEPEPYDVIPYLVDCYNKEPRSKRPRTFDEFKDFVDKWSLYQWWSRCEYEIIIKQWPITDKKVKWDIYKQITMNIDIVTNILIEEINGNKTKKGSK